MNIHNESNIECIYENPLQLRIASMELVQTAGKDTQHTKKTILKFESRI